MSSKCIVLVDSTNNIGGHGKKITDIILQFLEKEYESNVGSRFQSHEWTCSYDQKTPSQDDGCSCGLFLILNVIRVLKKVQTNKPLAIPSISKSNVVGPSWQRNLSAEDKRQLRLLMFTIIQKDCDITALLPFIVGVGEEEEEDEVSGAMTAEQQQADGDEDGNVVSLSLIHI